MNRRELLQAAVAALPIGATASELTIADGDELIAFKVTADQPLSLAARCKIEQSLRGAFAGTKWEKVPCLVLQRGLKLEVVKLSDAQLVTLPGCVCGVCGEAATDGFRETIEIKPEGNFRRFKPGELYFGCEKHSAYSQYMSEYEARLHNVREWTERLNSGVMSRNDIKKIEGGA